MPERLADLAHHGDAEAAPGLLDLAVNVRPGGPPAWLAEVLHAVVADVGRYPDPGPARAAVAARHGRCEADVLVTSGAAEAFTLVGRALDPAVVGPAVVVHPQFTEPEAALRRAGHRVRRLLLDAGDGFALDPARVPDDAGLVVVGNPTNPTSVLHPRETLLALARPGRVLVVDEAFMDAVPGEPATLAAAGDVPGLVVVRSLTKMWGVPGVRAGYLLAPAALTARLAGQQPPWSVSASALAVTQACSRPAAVREAAMRAGELSVEAARLAAALRGAGAGVPVEPSAPFVLWRLARAADVRLALRRQGVAVRRGDTFPGLGPDWLRAAARDAAATQALVSGLARVREELG